MQLTYTDQFGEVNSFVDEVVVLSTGHFYQVKVFNSAGEEVKTIEMDTPYGATASDSVDYR